MPDFACGTGSAVDHASVDDRSAAKPGSEGDHQDVIAVFTGSEFPFPIEIDTCIIIDIGRDMKMALHPGDDWNLLPFRKIRRKTGNTVFDIEDAGDADAHAGDILTGQVKLIEKCQNSIINAIENFGGCALFPELMKKIIENRNFDIGSTEIKPDIGCHKILLFTGAFAGKQELHCVLDS